MRSAQRGLRLVDGAHPARARRGHHPGARQRRPRARAAGPPESRARCRSAATPACRAAPRSAACPAVDAAHAARWAEVWGFPCRRRTGLDRRRRWSTQRAAARSTCFWMVGGNFLETLPDAAASRAALRRPRLRIHQDIVLSSSMLVDGDGDVLLLPATTRYESPGGGTETSTERRIIFSPEIPGRRIGSARPEWEVFREVDGARASRARRPRAASPTPRRSAHEIARAVPLYAGIETPVRARATRCSGADRTSSRTAASPRRTARRTSRAVAAAAAAQRAGPGCFCVSTRRGKQFNSMVQRDVDPLTGARRDDVLISAADLDRLGLRDGDARAAASRDAASSRPRCASRRSSPATSRCTGRRATCCSPARRSTPRRWSRTTTPW